MEKYSCFADPSTGCNPFLPRYSHHNTYKRWKFWRCLVLVPLLIVRIPLLLFSILLLLFIHLSTSPLKFFPKVQRHCRWILSACPLQLLLFLLGVTHTKQIRADLRQCNVSNHSKSQQKTIEMSPTPNFSPDTVLLCNHTNFIEIIYLTLKLYPLFVQKGPKNTLRLVNWMVAVADSLTFHSKYVSQEKQFSSLIELADYTKTIGPVVIFPEFSNTNGSALLRWENEALCPKTRTKFRSAQAFLTLCQERLCLVGFQYPRIGLYGLPHTIFSPWQHILFLLTLEFQYSLEFVFTSSQEVKKLLPQNLDESQWAKWPDQILNYLRLYMASMLAGVKTVDISGDQSVAFRTYYASTCYLPSKNT